MDPIVTSKVRGSHQVGIIGVGFVGESLVKVFAKQFSVIGYDVSIERVRQLKSSFAENRNVTIQNHTSGLECCELFCIAVPTLLTNDFKVDDKYVRTAVEMLSKIARPGSVVVMESSVSVGMTRLLLAPLTKSGVSIGFSPERIDPGRTEPPAESIPKIISGIDESSLERINNFYGLVFEHVVPVSSMETAEMCKLYENCFRMVNICYANEAADACKKHDIDPYEMIKACSTKPFGFMPFYPGLGVGGHCIPVNPYYLSANNDFPLLMSATETTKNRPQAKAEEVVNEHPNAERILVVGVAFKPGQSYCGNSPGLAMARALSKKHGKKVFILDPLVTECEFPLLSVKEAVDKLESKAIDLVCVAMKQHEINFELLNKFPLVSFTN